MSTARSIYTASQRSLADVNLDLPSNNKDSGNTLLENDFHQEEYSTILHKIRANTIKTKEDIAATIIQSTWRMYKYHHKFQVIYSTFKKLKQHEFRPFLSIILLNTETGGYERRLSLFNEMKSSLRVKALLPKDYKLVSFHCFRCTDQLCIPVNMDSEKLITFVKKMMAQTMRNVLSEWLIVTRKRKYDDKESFKLDRMSKLRFRLFYTIFMMWRRYAAEKHNEQISLSAQLNQYDQYVEKKKKAENLRNMADKQAEKHLKRRAIEALHNDLIEKSEMRKNMINAGDERLKKLMNYALVAWNKYIEKKRNALSAKKVIFYQWYKISSAAHNLKLLCSKFRQRHIYYVKRNVLSAFIKFRKANILITIKKRIEMKNRISLALWFAWSLIGNTYEGDLALAFHGWLMYTKGRRAWNNFIFNNIIQSDYDVLRKKALCGLRSRPLYLIPRVVWNTQFRDESEVIMNKSLSENTDPEDFSQLNTPEANFDGVASKEKEYEKRDEFMKNWMKLRPEPSLFVRVVALNINKVKPRLQIAELDPLHQFMAAFNEALVFFDNNGMASEGRFLRVCSAMKENDKNAIANRAKCVKRDNMIISISNAHEAALEFNKINPEFTVSEPVTDYEKVKEYTKSMELVPDINIFDAAHSVDEQSDPCFGVIAGCKSPIPTFRAKLDQLREKIKEDLLTISKTDTSALKKISYFKGGNNNHHKTAKTLHSIHIEMHNENKKGVKSSIHENRVDSKLSALFPQMERTGRVLHRQTHNVLDDIPDNDSVSLSHEEEKRETLPNLLSVQTNYSKSSLGSMMNSLQRFTSSLSMASNSSLKSSSEDLEKKESAIESEPNSSEASARSDVSDARADPLKVIENQMPLNDPNFSETFTKRLTQTLDNDHFCSKNETARKYAQFIELLFGSGSKTKLPISMANLRKSLYELMFGSKFLRRNDDFNFRQKQASLQISSLMDKYRLDRSREKEEEEEDDEKAKREDTAKKNRKLVPDDTDEKGIEVRYNSRHYKKRKKVVKKYRVDPETGEKEEIDIGSSRLGPNIEFGNGVRKVKRKVYDSPSDSRSRSRVASQANTARNDDGNSGDAEKSGDQLELRIDGSSYKKTRSKASENGEIHEYEYEYQDYYSDSDSDNSNLFRSDENFDFSDYSYDYEYNYEEDPNGEIVKILKTDSKTGMKKLVKQKSQKKVRKKLQRIETSKRHWRRRVRTKDNDGDDADQESSHRHHRHRHHRSQRNTERDDQGSLENSLRRRKRRSKNAQDSPEAGKSSRRTARNGNQQSDAQNSKSSRGDKSGRSIENDKSGRIDKNGKNVNSSESGNGKNVNSSKSGNGKNGNSSESGNVDFETPKKGNGSDFDSDGYYDDSGAPYYSDYYYSGSSGEYEEEYEEEEEKKEVYMMPPKILSDDKDSPRAELAKQNKFRPNPLALQAMNHVLTGYVQNSLRDMSDSDRLVDPGEEEEKQPEAEEPSPSADGSKTKRAKCRAPKYPVHLLNRQKSIVKPNSAMSNKGPKSPIVIRTSAAKAPTLNQVLAQKSNVSRLIYTQGRTYKLQSDSQARSSLPSMPPHNMGRMSAISSSRSTRFDSDLIIQNQSVKRQFHSEGSTARGLFSDDSERERSNDSPLLTQTSYQLKRTPGQSLRGSTSTTRSSSRQRAPSVPDYTAVKEVIQNLVRLIGSSNISKRDFEYFRRKIRMAKKLPAFVGLKIQKETTPLDQIEAMLQNMCCKYAINATGAANELIQFVEKHREIAPFVIEEVEKLAEERNDLSKFNKKPHVAELSWMTPKRVDGPVVQFAEQDQFGALLAPVNEEHHNTHHRHRRRTNNTQQNTWDDMLKKMSLGDFLTVTHFVPIELVQQVLQDANR